RPLNFRGVSFLPIQLSAFGPKAMASPGCGAPSAAFALFSRGSADLLDEQRAQAALRIIARHPSETAVDDMPDAIDGDRGLGDIRRHHDFAKCVRGKGAVLVLR